MTPRVRCVDTLILILGLLLPVVQAAADSWRVTVLGLDASRAAAPREAGEAVLVDVAALATLLGLTVRVDGGAVSVRDREGRIWSGAAGESRLRAPGEEILLDLPLRLEDRSVYLPAAAVAELAGLSLVLDRAAHRLDLVAPGTGQTAGGTTGDGWEPIVIAAPPAPAGSAEVGAPLPSQVVLPPARESLRLDMAVAHVLGEGWTGELSALGSVRGWEAQMSGRLAGDPAGLEMTQGRASLSDPETGWGGEAGDLFSDIRGSAQGVRLIRRRGAAAEPRAWPTLSLYLGEGGEDTVLAYHDELGLGRSAGISGEIATDGSCLLRGRWQRDHMGLFGYWRRDDLGGGFGVSGGLELPLKIGVQGGWSRSGEDENAFDQTTLSLHVPLVRGAEMGVESVALATGLGRARTDAVLLGAPLGPVRLRVRWQRRWSEAASLFGRPPVRRELEELRASATFDAGSRLKFDLQSVSQWAGLGSAEPWQQLTISWRPVRRTALQVWALSPSAPADDPLRVRLTQDLPRGFSLFAEFGRFYSFQDAGGWADQPRFKLQVGRIMQIGTPAGGGLVTGRVASPMGPAPAGTVVELGPYRTVTADDGSYAIPHVPRGQYEARIPEDALPASWAARGARGVEIKGRDRAEIDLELVPLGHVRGRVWEDRDGDGRPSPDEGVGRVVVLLGDRATSTEADGSFGFFNLSSGSYRLEIDPAHLPQGFILAAPSRMDLGLPPGSSLDNVALRVMRKQRPIIFQDLS
ncbi:MAG TPA: hypothetical protein VEW48_24200 [Thermoanaerobaculia bacterium]|nr:hypothetical protein [Thermoanaerobaculia bacterium]